MKSVVIITPTIASKSLQQCKQSVADQTYPNIKHLVVYDGFTEVNHFYNPHRNTEMIFLPTNVGADNFYGHRIYAAMAYLVNEDYVCFLDQDNYLEPNHIQSMVDTIESGNLDWVYSLRNIVNENGDLICPDNCESLGEWETWVSQYQNTSHKQYHIDTSCYMVRRDVLVQVAGAWYGKWGQDRVFFQTLKRHFPLFARTGEHTLNYRLGGNAGSVTEDFFLQGNDYMKQLYGTTEFPWLFKG